MNRPAAVPVPADRPPTLRLHSGAIAPEHDHASVLSSVEAFAEARRGLGLAAWLIDGTFAALACIAPAGEARR